MNACDNNEGVSYTVYDGDIGRKKQRSKRSMPILLIQEGGDL